MSVVVDISCRIIIPAVAPITPNNIDSYFFMK
jgi:hypothetical protein